jgi:hypothetical protein
MGSLPITNATTLNKMKENMQRFIPLLLYLSPVDSFSVDAGLVQACKGFALAATVDKAGDEQESVRSR